jgi:phosphoribosyl-ATP pyrophosphohydrolase
MSANQINLEALFQIIQNKILAKEIDSYTYSLAKEGIEKINRKIGEEAIEVILASFAYEKKTDEKTRADLIGEISDLFYHSLVLLATQKIEFSEILAELKRRNK